MEERAEPAASAPVSVVIPSYNHAAFIAECIDSVLAQQPPPLEAIVIDDGSDDGSLDILRGYGSRIVLLTQQRQRQARARNRGLALARGEFVAFVDSDDRFLPGRLAGAMAAFERQPQADVAWGDFRVIDGSGGVVDAVRWVPTAGLPFALALIAGNPICNASVTVRRSALQAIGGFDERLPRTCDGHAWLRLAARGSVFVHCGARPVVDYRLHAGNDSARLALMSRERDEALQSAVADYLRFGVIGNGNGGGDSGGVIGDSGDSGGGKSGKSNSNGGNSGNSNSGGGNSNSAGGNNGNVGNSGGGNGNGRAATGPGSLRWLRGVLIRQLAFGAAAAVDARIHAGGFGRLRRLPLLALGSAPGQQLVGSLRTLRTLWRPKMRP